MIEKKVNIDRAYFLEKKKITNCDSNDNHNLTHNVFTLSCIYSTKSQQISLILG